jgi:hypothetical protein
VFLERIPHRVRRGWIRPVAIALFMAFVAFAYVGPSVLAKPTQSRMHSGKMALSGGVLTALGVHSGAIVPEARGPAGSSLDAAPSASALPNVRVSNQGNSPVNENPIAANPNNALALLSGGNDYNCGTIQGFYTSDDGGATWPHQHCMGALAGKQGFGDPNVAYAASTNTAYILGIDANSGPSNGIIAFEKSTNNGVTWSAPAAGPTALFTGGVPDKPWTEIDNSPTSPFYGCIYTSITQFDATFNLIRITVDHSCDGGVTWSGPIPVAAQQTFPNVDQFSDLAIGNDGTVYVTYMHCVANGPAGDCGNTLSSLRFSKSTDGGNTWSAATQFATAQLAPDSCFCAFYGNVPGTQERTANIPVIDVDSSDNLYVAYYHYTGTFMQMKVIASINGGATWGAPVIVRGGSRDQFQPWLSVDDATGTVGVSYLMRGQNKYKAVGAYSTNGAASFTNLIISTVASQFTLDGFGGQFMGDYTGNIFAGGNLHAVWVDTRSGIAQDWSGGIDLP